MAKPEPSTVRRMTLLPSLVLASFLSVPGALAETPLSVTYSLDTPVASFTLSGWKFTDLNSNTTVSRIGNNNATSWSGTIVTSGTVSVKITISSVPIALAANITVTARNRHTAPASAGEVPNGTFLALLVPPQPTGTDSGLGESLERTGSDSFTSTFLSDNGPNSGYGYYRTKPTFIPLLFQYEINPDLENTGSVFFQKQCGTGGFISGSNLLAQTNRHEWNSPTQSHYAFYSASISRTNNPGDYVESRIALPGTTVSAFDQATSDGLTGIYSKILADFQREPFPVNFDALGNFLGNINYAPYASCN